MRWASRGGAAAALCLSVAGGCGPSPAAGPPPPRPPAATAPPPPETPAHEATPHRAVGTWEPDDVDTSAPPALPGSSSTSASTRGMAPRRRPSIEAVRRVRGLRHLAIRSHALQDVSALAGLEQLEVLVLDGSPRVSRVPPMTSLPALTRLGLHGTALSDIDRLAGADQLRALDLGGTPVEDLTPLGTLARLVELNLAGTFATDLSPLAKLQGLWALDVSHVPARDFSALHDLRCLRRLVVDFVAGFGLEVLPRAGALEALSARGTRLDDVSALGRHDGLVELWLGDNPALDDVAPLAGLPRLRFVDLSATSVTHLDPSSRSPTWSMSCSRGPQWIRPRARAFGARGRCATGRLRHRRCRCLPLDRGRETYAGSHCGGRAGMPARASGAADPPLGPGGRHGDPATAAHGRPSRELPEATARGRLPPPRNGRRDLDSALASLMMRGSREGRMVEAIQPPRVRRPPMKPSAPTPTR